MLLWSFLAFTAVVGVADLFGADAWKSFWSNFERMEGYITILHLLAYFLYVPAIFSTEKLWNRFIVSSLGASVAVSIFSIFQLVGVFTINQGGVRVDATFGNATYLAIYLVFHIFVALIAAVRSARWGGWLGYGAIALLEIVILYNTATRGAILGALGGLLIAGLLIALFDKKEKTLRIVAGSAIGIVVLLILGFFAIQNTQFVAHSPVLSRFAGLSWDDTRTQARAYVWPMAIEGWKEHPVLGWGQENFNYVFNANYDPRMYRHELWFDRTHNALLDWLIVGGALGLLTYLSLFGSALYLLWRKCPDISFTERALLTGLGAAYLFHNLFVFDNITSYIVFVSVLGYIHFRSTRLVKPLASDTDEVDESETRIAGVFLIALLLVSLYFFVYRGYATASHLLNALQYMSYTPAQVTLSIAEYEKALSYDTLGRPEIVERIVEVVPKVNGSSVSIEEKQAFFEMGKATLETQLMRHPGDARYELFAGSFYTNYGLNADAERHFIEAQKLSPKKQAMLFQLGSLYIGTKQYEKAIEAFRQAYDLEPSYDLAGIYYTASLIYAGRERDAQTFFKTHFPDTAMTDDSILRAYADTGNWRKVVEALRVRIAANPGGLDDRLSLVGAYLKVGERKSAVTLIREIITLDPRFKEQGENYIKEIEAGRNP
jgi:O-antigen ligase/tetratricopeptide (TPR) repeat protein